MNDCVSAIVLGAEPRMHSVDTMLGERNLLAWYEHVRDEAEKIDQPGAQLGSEWGSVRHGLATQVTRVSGNAGDSPVMREIKAGARNGIDMPVGDAQLFVAYMLKMIPDNPTTCSLREALAELSEHLIALGGADDQP